MDYLLLSNLSIIASGLIIGSFINVVAYRIPQNLPIVFSRSMCPSCNEQIPLYRNIPIITYIIQRGRTNCCNTSMSIQYPVIECLTSIIFLLGFNNYTNDEYLLFLWISSILIIISIIDYKTLKIPLILSVYIFFAEILFLIQNINNYIIMLWGLLFGISYLGVTFIITSLIYQKQTLGYGDLILIGLLGAWLGPINILICIFISAIIGVIIWLIKYFKNESNNKLPLGTYLSVSAIIIKILNLDFISYINNY